MPFLLSTVLESVADEDYPPFSLPSSIAANRKFFHNLLFIVWAYNICYATILFLLEARFSALCIGVGVVFINPAIYLLSRKGFEVLSRYLFICACLFYTCSLGLNVGLEIHIDYYFIPILVIPLLLFDSDQKTKIYFGMFLPLFAWMLLQYSPALELGPYWRPDHFPIEFFKTINFVGAFAITGIFLNIFIRHFIRERNFAVAKLNSQSKVIKDTLAWQHAVLDGAQYSIVSCRPDGLITTFNRKAQEMLGFNLTEVIGKLDPSYFHKKSELKLLAKSLSDELGKKIEPDFDTLKLLTENSNYGSAEWTYVDKKQTEIPIRLIVSAIKNESEKLIGYLYIAEDLTEQRKLVKIIDTQKAQMITTSKLSALGEMAAGIAHEINNPLTIINNRVSQMRSRLTSQIIEKDQLLADLGKVEQTIDRIAKIVRGLSIFSRNSEKDPMRPGLAKQIIEETLELCRERILKAGIALTVESDPLITIECRGNQISQVVMNLINNAIDAMEDQQNKWIRITCLKEDDQAVLKITDSGLGIPEYVANKVMQPFFTTKEVGKGTGLGLSISKGIVEDHRGKLYYNSACENTQFVVEIPFVRSLNSEVVSK